MAVRSVSTTIPPCRVEDAPSSPARYPGPLIMTACRCAGSPPDPSPATSSTVPAGNSAASPATCASARRTAATRPPPAAGSDPRSATVSGHRASTATLTAETAGRYEPTTPPGPASASAAPGPTAVAHPPGPAADASSPHRGPYFSPRSYDTKDGIAATRAGPATPTRPDPPLTAGNAGHPPVPPCGTCARSPPFSVSHASAGHVSGPTAKSTSDPTEPNPATFHNAGVVAGEISVHRNPEIPTTTT